MAQAIPECVTLPHSKAKIHFLSNFDKEKLVDLTRRLVADEELAKRMRTSPSEELAKLGILVSDEDRKRITDEDMLVAMGHRAPAGEQAALGPLVVVLVIVGVINVPEPAY
jgi:hypothetical protein